MSVNTAHANNGVLLHAGEYILIHCERTVMEFSGQDDAVFHGMKSGRIYLTSHRMVFISRKSDAMQSFSAPFIALSDVDVEQPIFGPNYLIGKVRAQPNGNFIGEVKFKLHFKSGGAIEYGMALMHAAKAAQNNYHSGGGRGDNPPPYTPSGNWYEVPPPAYEPPPNYYGWLPQHHTFTDPAPNTVFMSDNPPPYPGIGGPAAPAYNPNASGLYPSVPSYPYNPQQQQQQYNPPPYSSLNPGSNGQQQQPQQQQQQQQQGNVTNNQPSQQQEEMPSWNGFSLPPPDEEERQQQRQQQHQQSSAPPMHSGAPGVLVRHYERYGEYPPGHKLLPYKDGDDWLNHPSSSSESSDEDYETRNNLYT